MFGLGVELHPLGATLGMDLGDMVSTLALNLDHVMYVDEVLHGASTEQ